MVRMTEAELQRSFGALADRARRERVMITTQDGRDEFVVLSTAEYARLKRRDRRVGLAEDSPRSGLPPCATPRCRTNSLPSTPS